MNIETVIFREYDMRGIYPENINEELAFTLGKSFGTYVLNLGKKEVLVGYDNRLSSVGLSEALISGLISTGINVTNLELVTTPMFYYARNYLNIWSGIMITASHNPSEYNGFKISFDEKGNAVGQEIYDFRDFTLKGEFVSGQGLEKKYDIKNQYIQLIKESLNFGDRKIKVVVDCGNGTGSVIIKDILDALPLEYSLLYAESDGTFPNHHPDPSVSENLKDLQRKVLELNYDLGFAIDADADRVRIIDELGNILNVDLYMIIMYRYLKDKLKNNTALFDVKCSKALIDELEKLGIKKIMSRTGNSYLYRRVHEENVDFGGEYSGHVFFNDRFPGFDDGIYGGLRMVETLSHTDKPLSHLLEGINHYFSTDELKLDVTEENKFEIIEKLKKYLQNKGYHYNSIDGARIEFEDGWALIRASNTGPYLTLRFEAKTKEQLNTIKKDFMIIINKIINDELIFN